MQVFVVAGSEPVARDLIAQLAEHDDILVIGASSGLDDARRLAPFAQAAIVHSSAPDPRALVRALHDDWPDLRIVAVGLPLDPIVVLEYIEAGALATLHDTSPPEMLARALRAIEREELVFDQLILAQLIERLQDLHRELQAEQPDRSVTTSLTSRERGILLALTSGNLEDEILADLNDAEDFREIIHRILRKLGVSPANDYTSPRRGYPPEDSSR